MMGISNRLVALLAAAAIASPVLAKPSQFPAPVGVTLLLRDQAIGCYRGYSFSTSSTLKDVVDHYDRQARKSGLNRSAVQQRPGFHFSTYNDASGFSLSVAVNAQSKPTTATVMYREGKSPIRC